MKNDDKKEKKNILFIALKRHKISLAIVLFFIMASTAFAWFVYNKTVDVGMGAHVKSWKVYIGDDEEGDTYEIDLSDLYPGMNTIDGDEIPINNEGEMDANVTIQIKSLKLFGVTQIAGAPGASCDSRIDHNDPNFVCDYTVSQDVYGTNGTQYTIEGYPFELKFYLSSSVLHYDSTVTDATLDYSLEWDFESCPANDTSCDERDTWYGEKSFEYGSANPSLEVVLTVKFTEVTP